MGISEVEIKYYYAFCDNQICNEETDECISREDLIHTMETLQWKCEDDFTYCPKCKGDN